VKAAAAWRIVGITGMLMAVIGTSYALYQSTQVKLVPYIVEVDKLGTAVSAGFPQQIEYADPRVVRATLGSFVTNFRSVTPDAVVQKQYIDRTYALLRTSDPATEKVNAWFRSATRPSKARRRDRRHRGQQHRAALEPELPDRLDRISSATGRARSSRRAAFRGVATVTLTPPQDEASSASIRSASTSATSTGRRSCERPRRNF
jgi:hypothetical protein